MTIKKPADLVTAAVLLVGTGFIYLESLNIDTSNMYAMGPRFVPNLLMGALVLLSLCLGLQSVDFSSKAATRAKSEFRFSPDVLLMQASSIGLVVVYLLVLPYLTYIPSTILFLVASMILLGKRTVKDMALCVVTACVVTGGLYYIFAELLNLFLP